MKILFLLGASSRVRNFDRTIMDLAGRGHEVVLAGRLRKGAFALPETVEHPRVSARVNPTERADEWREFVDLLRGARDYLRYFDPRYARATRLVRRAYEIAPTPFVLFCERHRWVKRRWKLAAAALALCEDLIPTDAAFAAFLRDEAPDLVLVTPLVTFESYQTDYVKAAHRLGLPIAFIPFSWDNLTNKGLMRVLPDRVLVWNEIQRREAIELHGSPPASAVVTGAARFDDFFGRQPATTRGEFFAQFGFDPGRPMVLYLGSSQLTGPNEMELVRRWAESIRTAADEALRSCAILIRPHPAVRASWTSVDLSALGAIGVSLQASRNADQDLYDSLYHAHAAIGLNTSAMLEAAIVGRPVYTLIIPGFDEGQTGTIHFSYLVEAFGGLASVARDFAEHHRQLAAVLQGDPVCSDRSRAFAGAFLRPHGADRPVFPILATEIERCATVVKRPQTDTPLWHGPARRALLWWLRRGAATGGVTEDTTVVGTSISLRAIKTALEEIQQGTAPILVGPWIDTTAQELLYWVPFVRWASATYGLAAERLIVLSHGGAPEWYGPLASRFVEVADLFSAEELAHWMARTVPQSVQNPKQAVMFPFDQEVVERAARAFDLADHHVLHPSFFFRVLLRLRKDLQIDRLGDVLRAERLASPAVQLPAHLPKSFIAVSAGFTPALPETPENGQLLQELISQVSARHDVVIVDAAATVESVLTRIGPSGRVHLLDDAGEPRPRQLQTAVLAQAKGYIGPYGDLAVLAAFCGTAVTAYHSERIADEQVERLQQAAGSAGWGEVVLQRSTRFKKVRFPV